MKFAGLMRSLPKLEQFQAKAIAAHGLDLMKMQHVGKPRLDPTVGSRLGSDTTGNRPFPAEPMVRTTGVEPVQPKAEGF